MKTHSIPAGWLLNYWAGRALGYEFEEYARDAQGVCYAIANPNPDMPHVGNVKLFYRGEMLPGGEVVPKWSPEFPDYCADPRAGWPVIRDNLICIERDPEIMVACGFNENDAYACMPGSTFGQYDQDPMIAALRCKIESAFGKEVPQAFE